MKKWLSFFFWFYQELNQYFNQELKVRIDKLLRIKKINLIYLIYQKFIFSYLRV